MSRRGGIAGLTVGQARHMRVGTRVRFEPNPVSLMLYSRDYRLPARGEEGEVTVLGGRAYMPGPGGGLVYVDWARAGTMGISPYDLEKVR